MFRYMPRQEELHTAETGHYRTYGIEVWNDNNELVAFVSDVSTDPKAVAKIVALCTVGQLDPEQLRDVLYNMLE